MKNAYLALDLGAGSGRAIAGYFKDGHIYTDEILRFENRPVKLGDTVYWDFLSLFDNVKNGISISVKKGYDLRGIGVDTWGVDFGFLDRNGKLLSNPVTYRDNRTAGMSAEAFKSVSKEVMYRISGIQLMEINTLFQLLSLVKQHAPVLGVAEKLLFTPDLINYFLTGKAANEYTIASTSQLLNAQTRAWDESLFEHLGLPLIMEKVINPGETIGLLTKEIVEETGASKAKVYAVGSHDTASAIGAIPAEGDNWAFLSSGTWSLLGVLTENPILTEEAFANDFTNEGGVDGKILFMRNITGLWLLQRLIAGWEKEEGQKQLYEVLLLEASKAVPFRSVVDSDNAIFSNPLSMSEAINEYCKNTKQPVPQSKGEYVRCVLESLALKYSVVMERLKQCTGKSIEKLYVVGGGSQNTLLNQMIADALNMEVVVGLTEATAIGNIMQQAIADKYIKDWKAGHKIIRNSFNFVTYKPEAHDKWLSQRNKNL